MRHSNINRVGGRTKTIKGGNLSNITKLEEDFAKHISFGKSDSPEKQSNTSAAIKKKFSI